MQNMSSELATALNMITGGDSLKLRSDGHWEHHAPWPQLLSVHKLNLVSFFAHLCHSTFNHTVTLEYCTASPHGQLGTTAPNGAQHNPEIHASDELLTQ